MKTDSPEQRGTILIVEDDENVSDALSQLLDCEGYVTIRAGSGRQAVDAAASTAPDLVVLDLVLPDRNGIEVLGDLKAIKRETPVVILTGFGSPESVRDAMETGAFDYLTKPFDIQEFCGVVRAALQSDRSMGPLPPI